MRNLTHASLGTAIAFTCTIWAQATLFSADARAGVVIHVTNTGLDTNDGLTWGTAKLTVAAGLTAAVSGDQVWVAGGTYNERITLVLGVELYGSFLGTENLLSERPAFPRPPGQEHMSYLDGNDAGTVVTSPSGATTSTRLDGFILVSGHGGAGTGGGISCSNSSPTIANNIISGNFSSAGGGIYCSYSTASISNNTISGNTAYFSTGGYGGGICCYYSSPIISNNTISGNSAGIGGGIYCYSTSSPLISNNTISGNAGGGIYCSSSSSPTISNNTISGNTASNTGGGIYCSYSSPAISNNTISGNNTPYDGGGIYCSYSSPAISNNTILGNTASYKSGGGIFCSHSSPAITNNTITGNSALGGGGIFCDSSSPTVSNNIVALNSSGVDLYSGTPVLRNNCVYNPGGFDYAGLSPGTGDFSADPQFVDPQYGEVHLKAISPCINSGNNSVVQPDWKDIDGEARIQNGTVDIGADEFNGTAPTFTPIVVRVGPTGNDANDGSSWDLAKQTVQAGIDAAAISGGEVWVAAGTYNQRITLKYRAFLYGGFAGTETSRDQRNWATHVTILDGGAGGSVVFASSVPGYRFSAIDGFTVRNGSAIYYGGGISCYQSSPTISNNTISGNSTGLYGDGGGITCNQSSPTISNNTISGNSGGLGGGICCYSTSSPLISNNTISGNTAGSGGGIYYEFSSPSISNNIVALNSSGIGCGDNGGGVLRNNCVYNPSGYNYSRLNAGTGDLSVDPQFVYPQYGDFHLKATSPCINVGDNSAVSVGSKDMDGEERIQNGTVDIGADEFNGTEPPPLTPAIIRVSPSGNDGNDGSSWDLAKQTVQAGIDAAAISGGEVWVAAGTYNQRITLKYRVFLYGGFAGTENSRDQRDWATHVTILDGNAGGSVVTATAPGYRSSAIDGFTIRNGSAKNGGGIYCASSAPPISNNKITANTASSSGGGIYCASDPVISNNTIWGNNANSTGGGIYCDFQSSAAIVNNTIVGNTASVNGGAIRCNASASTISNNVVAMNSSGVYKTGSQAPVLRNNCVYNPGGYNYSGLSAGTGDIAADPLFVNSLSDFHLRPGSPCIDAGYNAGVPAGVLTDLDGHLRIVDDPATPDCQWAPGNCGTAPIVDMGAYEFDPLGDDDQDGVPNGSDLCPNTVPGSPVDANGCPPVIPGDSDHDGDVDAHDLDVFKACASGQAIPYAGNCAMFDFDTDTDVDQQDFGIFQRCYSGKGILADPNCAN